MIQATESWHGNDLATCTEMDLVFTTRWSFLLQREMRSVVVVVADVLAPQAFQILFVKHYYVVEQVTPTVTDPAFCNPVLPRAFKHMMPTGPLDNFSFGQLRTQAA